MTHYGLPQSGVTQIVPTTDKHTLLAAIDKEIADLQERTNRTMELLKRDATTVAGQFQYIATSVSLRSLTSNHVDMNKLASVFAWQNRLTEIAHEYDVLMKLRAEVEAGK